MAADLEASFDADTALWFRRYESDGEHAFDALDAGALVGMDLEGLPALASARADESLLSWVTRSLGTVDRITYAEKLAPDDLLKQVVHLVVEEPYGPKLWEDKRGAGLQPGSALSGWHDPEVVWALALLWRQYPGLRPSIPLERILDYWSASMAEHPFPTREFGKGWTEEDHSADSLAYAAAALEIGREGLGDRPYAQARDNLLALLRKIGEGARLYDAMVTKTDWPVPHSSYDGSVTRDMAHYVAVYGQLCGLLGRADELQKARDWVAAALSREGAEGQKLFECYHNASFEDRCALLAMLRGLSPLFTAPSVQAPAGATAAVTQSSPPS